MNQTRSILQSLIPGQRIETILGIGVVSSVSLIDSLIFVALPNKPKALYIFKPEQIIKSLAGV
jgi:hypothetical protein